MPQGVYLFLGYSEKDESLLKEVTGEGAEDALGAIQGLVSYHNVNANKVSANSYQRRVHSHLLNTVNFHISETHNSVDSHIKKIREFLCHFNT